MLDAPLRIALLIDHLESDYPLQIVHGVLRATRSSRARTWIVPGGWLARSATEPVVRNFVYDLLARAKIDGFVFAAGSLSNYCGVDEFTRWSERFQHAPCVSVGLDVQSLASVHVDNESGMYAAVSHLIERHGRRKVAFIAGPAGSSEAQARQRAYQRAIRDHSILTDARFVVEGGFGRENGMAAMNELLDERGLLNVIDAVAGVNDDVILGAIEVLNRRGIAVPAAISLVGFDDSEGSRTANPPLTTVNQQVELQAYTATRSLLDAIERRRKPEAHCLESRAVFRASCGCPIDFQNNSAGVVAVKVSLARTCRLALIERRSAVIAELSRAAAGRMSGSSGWENRLLEALMQDLDRADSLRLMAEFDSIARRHVATGRGIKACHDILSALRLQTIACASIEPACRPHLEDIFQETRLALALIGSDSERSRQEANALRFRLLTKTCLGLLAGSTSDELPQLLEQHLPALGIESYAISAFGKQGVQGALRALAVRAPGIWRNNRGAPSSELSLVLDPAVEQEETLILTPLDFNGEPQGLAALGWGAPEVVHYEMLREILSVAAFAQRNQNG